MVSEDFWERLKTLNMSSIRELLTVILLLGILFGNFAVSINAAPNEDWPMFQHDPSHTGQSSSALPDTISVLWEFKGEGITLGSYPSIANGMLYIGGMNGLYCLDSTTGVEMWNFSTGDKVYSTPSIVNNRVYFGSDGGNIYSLDARTGGLIWSYPTGHTYVRSSPVVVNGTVFIASHNTTTGYIYSINANTGQLLWKYIVPGGSSSPSVSKGRVFIGSLNRTLYSFNQSTGDLLWRFNADSDVTSPSVVNGRVYFATTEESKDPLTGFYDRNLGRIYSLDAITGHEYWNVELQGGVAWGMSPTVIGGKVFIGTSGGYIYSFNAISGAIVWNVTLPNVFHVLSSIIGGHGKIYVGTGSPNRFYSLNMTTGDILWSYITGRDSNVRPAIAEGKLYMHNLGDHNLLCLGAHTQQFILELGTGWNMVSLPVIPNDPSAASVLSSVGFYQLVTWSGTGYTTVTEFEAGRGYWLLVLSNVNITISGTPVGQVTLNLTAGWSMVGGPNRSVAANDVVPGFYQLRTWKSRGYKSATDFEPGRGYWALVLAQTQIQLPPP